jgi:hypothetical protein
MKKVISTAILFFAISMAVSAQNTHKNDEKEHREDQKQHVKVPAAVSAALMKKYPEASKVTWEKEAGNYEANWGGKDGEENSVQFTPAGNFVEIVKAIPVDQLPKPALEYIKMHYKNAKVKEAGMVTDAAGKTFYEAEVNGKDIVFDASGKFVKVEK